MIASSGMAKSLAVSLAVAVHGAAVAVVFTPVPVEIEGDAGGVAASIGNSFADMADGVMTPEATEAMLEETPAEAVTPRDEPQETRPVAPEETMPEVVLEQTARSQPAQVAAETPGRAEPVPAQPGKAAPAPARAPLVPVRPAKQAPEEAQPLVPQQAETLASVEEPSAAVSRSLRPRPRSAAFEERHEPSPPKAAPTKTSPKSKAKSKPRPQGNAQQNARTGTATGVQTTKKSASQGSGQAAASGNAAASNYPGQVMRKISRVPRPRVGARGTAVVAFRIASNGGLAGVSIAQSSGSAKLDQAALRMIQRAAPFPPPPAGARRSFSINVKGG